VAGIVRYLEDIGPKCVRRPKRTHTKI